jgi:hypothetical protein
MMGPPTLQEINRYRTHHGTNIGAVFVLERWLFPNMFLESAKGGSELSAITAYVEAHGMEAAQVKWEEVFIPLKRKTSFLNSGELALGKCDDDRGLGVPERYGKGDFGAPADWMVYTWAAILWWNGV